MAKPRQESPAEAAARRALDEVFQCIRINRSFRLEAGAGAGKTYSLVEALRFVIDEQGIALKRACQKVACITYTNVATEEIVTRTDGHPVVHASTIHAFCWDLIKGFQPQLRVGISEIEAWRERIETVGEMHSMKVDYDLGYRIVEDKCLLLHHDDILSLTVTLMKLAKFRRVLAARYPILFIDEYQDTNVDFAVSILEHFVANNEGPLIGLFGDHWQKIYGDGIGSLKHENLKAIGKEANFRSGKVIVDALNGIRPELPQGVRNPEEMGSVAVYHSNGWTGTRRSGSHWSGDLPRDVAHRFLEGLQRRLARDGWDFDSHKTKILMLTHKVLAAEQDYAQVANAFRYTDAYVKKEDPHIAFLVDTVEPVCEAFLNRRYGEMFAAIGGRSERIRKTNDKVSWTKDIQSLIELRNTGSVGDVLDVLRQTCRPRLPDAVAKTEAELAEASPDEVSESRTLTQIRKLRDAPYREIISLARFVNDHTPFSTKHGVKGAEFEDVLVVFGRGWNHYNWNQFLEWFPDRFAEDKRDFYERNRNLFYVCCSRPKQRLAMLFTQKLSETALSRLEMWFGTENVTSYQPE